ncbi:MAG TPA: aminodeoxychorismate synthase component I [Solirubrobacteraceae bacterium]|jgi:para-aminobenzoate synthetase|nr:aminodeoxychorismate synthase component I [Solirubrobacteraceae bacterium]
MPTLLIDNHDSNTFNLFQLLAQIEEREPVVVRNDEAGWEDVDLQSFSKIVISAGPGRPERSRDFGLSSGALAATAVPLLGVCLGHQGLVLAHGGALRPAPRPMHGRRSRIFHSACELFEGVPQGFLAVRYHSLAVPEPLPDSLEVTARTSSGTVMAVRHRTLPHWGVQFHPESVQTENGERLLRNFLALAETRRERARPVATARRARNERPAGARRELEVIVETVNDPVDSESAFVQLYGESETAFWLDSASHATGMGRFSYMGSGGGPLSRLLTHRVGGEDRLFDTLDQALGEVAAEGRDFFCGGFVGYLGYELKAECGAAGEHRSLHPDAMLLFADRLIAFDHPRREAHVVCLSEPDGVAAARGWAAATAERLRTLGPAAPPRAADPGGSTGFGLRRAPEDYLRDIETCQEHLAQGESYEICLTNELHAPARVDALAVHRALRRINPAPFAAFLRLGGIEVSSSSPERFLSLARDGVLEAKPIKGTVARGATPSEDREAAARLRSAAKDRAENLMIVDVLRNDLGRVAEIGSVSVPTLMGVESYATVHQLVSTIRARLREDATLGECLQACFPGGSMTGAPKRRTMEIIDRLESRPRGIYSGAIGYLGVDGSADLSIAIRTLVSSSHGTTIGAGGAITVESDPRGELRELLLKARAPLQAVGLALHGRRDAAVLESTRATLSAAG